MNSIVLREGPSPEHVRSHFRGHLCPHELRQSVYLIEITVPRERRGKGVGSGLLAQWLARNDRSGRASLLLAFPYELEERRRFPEFRRAQGRLIAFYERLGFVHIGEGWMYRKAAKARTNTRAA